MKKVLLLCAVAFSFLAADAQTKTNKKSAKKPSKESVAKANYNKKEAAKKIARQAQMDSLMIGDSVRRTNDSLAYIQMEAGRVVYKENGLRAIDSTNKESFAALSAQRAGWEKTEKSEADIAKAASLSEYESKQVRFINQQYNEKAKMLIDGGDPMLKKQELITLNEERRAKIQTIVGKGQEKRLDKERKSYLKKNGASGDNSWVDLAEQYATAGK